MVDNVGFLKNNRKHNVYWNDRSKKNSNMDLLIKNILIMSIYSTTDWLHVDRVAYAFHVLPIIWIGTIFCKPFLLKLCITLFNVANIIFILLKYKILTFINKILRKTNYPIC